MLASIAIIAVNLADTFAISVLRLVHRVLITMSVSPVAQNTGEQVVKICVQILVQNAHLTPIARGVKPGTGGVAANSTVLCVKTLIRVVNFKDAKMVAYMDIIMNKDTNRNITVRNALTPVPHV